MSLLLTLQEQMRSDADPARSAEVFLRTARCAEGLGDPQRALAEYRQAAELLPNDRRVLYGLGVQSFKAGHLEEAQRTLSALLAQSEKRLDRATRLQIHLHLGECATKLGDLKTATRHLEWVVEDDPSNLDAISAVVEVLVGASEWSEAIRYLERMVALQQDPAERTMTFERIAILYRDHLADAPSAISALEAAVSEGRYSRSPLIALMELHEASEHDERARELSLIHI